MSLAQVRQDRRMPWLRRGMRMMMNGKSGRVTSAARIGTNIRVHFDGESHSSIVHPYWEMVYYCDGHIIADYRTQAGKKESE